jgi:hypothetical protein
MDETVDLAIADHNEYGDPIIRYSTYCLNCAEIVMLQGRHLFTFEDEYNWMTQ